MGVGILVMIFFLQLRELESGFTLSPRRLNYTRLSSRNRAATGRMVKKITMGRTNSRA